MRAQSPCAMPGRPGSWSPVVFWLAAVHWPAPPLVSNQVVPQWDIVLRGRIGFFRWVMARAGVESRGSHDQEERGFPSRSRLASRKTR